MIKEFSHSGWDVDVVTPVAHYPFGRRALPRWMAGRPFRLRHGQFTEKILHVPYLRHGNSRAARLLDQCYSALLVGPRRNDGPASPTSSLSPPPDCRRLRPAMSWPECAASR